MSAVNDLSGASQDFQEALGSLRRARSPEDVVLAEIPAPTHLAPFSAAVRADVRRPAPSLHGPAGRAGSWAALTAVPGAASGPHASGREDELATGRFVLLHDPSEPVAWGGPFRIVTWARAPMAREIGWDDAAGATVWSWLLQALDRHGAGYSGAGGTASRVLAEDFGVLGDREEGVDVELRASWTPDGPDVEAHLAAWSDAVGTFVGLRPCPRGVTVLHPRH